MRVIWMLDGGQAVNVFAYTCTVNLIDKSCILSRFVQIPSIPTGLFVSAKGEGCCLMQVLLVSGKHNPTFSPWINNCTLPPPPPPHLEANPSLDSQLSFQGKFSTNVHILAFRMERSGKT